MSNTNQIPRGRVSRTIFYNRVRGFHENGNPVWRSGLGFSPVYLYPCPFFVIFGETSTSWFSRALERRPQKWLVKISFVLYTGRTESPGCIWLSELSSSPWQKVNLVPWCWGKCSISVARTIQQAVVYDLFARFVCTQTNGTKPRLPARASCKYWYVGGWTV